MAQNNWSGMMQVEGMLDKIGVVLNEFVKHSHPLNNFTLLDKLYNIVTGNLLQRKSIMQFIGERMKAQCLSNFWI